MDVLTGASSNIVLGTIAGMTIFLGLPVARWKGASERLRGLLAVASAGVLLFLIIEVGHNAIEIVESSAKSGAWEPTVIKGLLLVGGLIAGLVGLAWLEEKRTHHKTQGATPFEIANMIALGIGLHNFAEGLAIGQSFSGGQVNLGWILVIGFALHNATEGFGIAGPLVGQEVPWSKLIVLGLIGGAPTTLGAVIGGFYVNENLELLFLSLAVGSLIYVTRELLRLRFASLTTIAAMSAVTVGLLLGIGSELFVEVASVHNASAQASISTSTESEANEIHFTENKVVPNSIAIARGKSILLVNETDKPFEFEAHTGLIAQEAFLPAKSKAAVTITGAEGKYTLSPEGKENCLVQVNVLPGKSTPLVDEIATVAAMTILEGHARAAHDLHIRALSGQSPDPVLDLKRAGKHAHHPMREILEDQGPKALMVQNLLQKYGFLESLKIKLHQYSKLAADKDVSTAQFNEYYEDLLANVEQIRKAIGQDAYKTADFKKKAALLVLSSAEDEYKEAVEDGEITVKEAAVPGKDEYLEYQDTRGFLQACRHLLAKNYKTNLSADSQAAFLTLLTKEFSPVDPANPSHPTPFKTIEGLFERIEKSLS